MKKILLLSAITAFAVTSDAFADARKFNGFHVGAELGAGAARFNDDRSFNNDVVALANRRTGNRADISGTGVTGGINLGYGMVHAPSHVYFGLNIGANFSNFKGDKKDGSTDDFIYESNYSIKNSFSADFRLGYAFENALVYGLIGVISSKIDVDTSLSTIDPAAAGGPGQYAKGESSKRKTGLLLGIGVEVPVAERFSIGGEYRYAHYGDVKYDMKVNNATRGGHVALVNPAVGGVVTTQKVKPSSHSFVVTAKYRF